MPFYEYTCPNCGTQFSKRRSMDERDLPAPCPDCDNAGATRRISIPMAFARGDDGAMRVIGNSGSPCGSCVATSCAGCM